MFRSERARLARRGSGSHDGGSDRRMRGEFVIVVERAAAPAAAASSSTSAHASTSSGGSGARMAIFYYNPSPYGIASLKGAQQEAGKLGVKLDAFDANNNPQLQSTQIQDAITTGKYKAFWVWGLNDVALTQSSTRRSPTASRSRPPTTPGDRCPPRTS